MLLKDLKAMKEIKVQRIDNNFIPDNEIIENFEKQVKNEGLEILDVKESGTNREYVLFKSGEYTHKYALASWHKTDEEKDNFLKDIVSEIDLKVIKSYRDDEFIYIVTDGSKIYYTLRLNSPDRQKVLNGMLVIRSNDYYFEYINKENRVCKMFGDVIKKEQLLNDRIVIKNKYVNVEYIFA